MALAALSLTLRGGQMDVEDLRRFHRFYPEFSRVLFIDARGRLMAADPPLAPGRVLDALNPADPLAATLRLTMRFR